MRLIRYVREGINRKLSGLDRKRGRILVIENPELGFDLGPLVAKVLRIPYCDGRRSLNFPHGRSVVSMDSAEIPYQYVLDLKGNFGEYLMQQMTGGVDIRIEALKISMQQLAKWKGF